MRLRALRAEDADHHLRWRNDPAVAHWATGDALRLLVGHLFGSFALHRVEPDTWSGNTRAVRARGVTQEAG